MVLVIMTREPQHFLYFYIKFFVETFVLWKKLIVMFFCVSQSTNGALKTINSSRLTVDVEGNLWFSNVTRNDMSDEFLYACSAASYFRNEYKLGNRVFLQVKLGAERKEK
jgi:hypothetical protein